MGAITSLEQRSIAVEPGGEATCSILVRNTGTVVDQFTVDVLGDARAWARVEPASVYRGENAFDAIAHLATNVPPVSRALRKSAWETHNRLRTDATRYLLPGAAAAALTIALASRRGGWVRIASALVLAAAALIGVRQTFALGYPNVPSVGTPLAGVALGAVAEKLTGDATVAPLVGEATVTLAEAAEDRDAQQRQRACGEQARRIRRGLEARRQHGTRRKVEDLGAIRQQKERVERTGLARLLAVDAVQAGRTALREQRFHAPFRVRGRVMISLDAVARALNVRARYDARNARIEVVTPGIGETQ